jgi:Cu/Ag efflux protein CusF
VNIIWALGARPIPAPLKFKILGALTEPERKDADMRNLLIAAICLGLSMPAAAADHPLINGVITKIDTAASKVTLKHEAIPYLNMEAMTMPYMIKAPATLEGFEVGDKVKFEAEEVDGLASVVRLENAK